MKKQIETALANRDYAGLVALYQEQGWIDAARVANAAIEIWERENGQEWEVA